MRPKSREGFQYAIICGLALEMDAMVALLDECYDIFGRIYGKCLGDRNIYTTGRIGSHSLVLCQPADIGKAEAAATVATLLLSFPNVRLVFVVGICGGVPFPPAGGREIFLGDLLISDSIIEYDVGELWSDGFQRMTGIKQGQPIHEIRSLLSTLRSDMGRRELREQTKKSLSLLQGLQNNRWACPDVASDVLFESSYQHRHRQGHSSECICVKYASEAAVCKIARTASCRDLGCEEKHIRRRRSDTESSEWALHIGTFASADTVMKSGEHRDALAEKENVIGFEMEGAGIWDTVPCLIIKSVCDYADSHKSQTWQNYAAAMAASGAKAILENWIPTTKPALEPMSRIHLEIPVPQTVFIGRGDELKKMEKNFQQPNKRRKELVLWGHRGSGKTQLAMHFTTVFRESYESIIWIDSSSRHTILESFAHVCSKLQAHLERGQSAITPVLEWLEDDTNLSWILVFDNVESCTDIDLQCYLPDCDHGHILLTTTSRDLHHRLNFASIHIEAVDEQTHSESCGSISSSISDASDSSLIECASPRMFGIINSLNFIQNSFLRYGWTMPLLGIGMIFRQYITQYVWESAMSILRSGSMTRNMS